MAAILAGVAVALGVLGTSGAAVADAASFDASPPSGTAPLTVTFTDTTLLGFDQHWTSTDGWTAIGSQVTHTFGVGVHTVTLTVTDPANGTTTAFKDINVSAPPPPTSSFTATPTSGNAPLFVQFTDTSSGGATAWSWTFGDPASGASNVSGAQSPSHTFQRPGTYLVRLQASNASGSDPTPAQVTITVPNRPPPTPKLTVTPNPAALGSAGATVSFDASATGLDPDGDPLTYEWEFGDDSPPLVTSTPQTTHLYIAPNAYPVAVTISDGRPNGSIRSKTIVLQVVVSPLTAAFMYAPANPGVGQAITLTSTSVGPDSPIVSQAWDLDNDGQFDDASGPVAQWSFGAAGAYQVSLKVTNDKGVSSASFQTINVTGPATAQSPAGSASGAPQPTSSNRRISPFPIVRMRGRLVNRAAVITLFTIKAPKGTVVRVRCTGRGCPYRRRAKIAKSNMTPVRFKGMERRLRAGTVIEVLVTKANRVGKYTRFRIRSGAAPLRVDRCLPRNSFKPTTCSSLT